MSLRCQTGPTLWASRFQGMGATGAYIRANTGTGEHGPGIFYNDWESSADDSVEFRAYSVSVTPAGGTFSLDEDGRFTFSGAPDGTYSINYGLRASEVDKGMANPASTITIGNVVVTLNMSVAGTGSIAFSGVAGALVQILSPDDYWPAVRKVKVNASAVRAASQLLDYEEVENIGFDFSSEMLPEEMVVAASCTVELRAGLDSAPNTILDSSTKFNGKNVVQRVKGNAPNTTYTLRVIALLNSGRQLVGTTIVSFGIR